jgi:xylulose-5-phosphate/fructose-6-phosphate phosphoketolase
MSQAADRIAKIQRHARATTRPARPRGPMIMLRTPKGWTAPKEVDGQPAEGTFRSHQVPLRGERRMSANPHANGGLLLRELESPADLR